MIQCLELYGCMGTGAFPRNGSSWKPQDKSPPLARVDRIDRIDRGAPWLSGRQTHGSLLAVCSYSSIRRHGCGVCHVDVGSGHDPPLEQIVWL